MEIKKRNRSELKSFFVKNAIPTEGEFAELIEGMLNQKDDGLAKLPGSPLSIEASGDAASQKKVLNFYKNISNADPDWVLSLNPRSDPAKPATAKPGFSISDHAGNSRLFIDQSTGHVGIGTVAPGAKLEVQGNIFAGNSDLYFTKTNHNHSGIGNTTGYAAIENAANYDALMILGRAGTTNGRSVKLWDYLQVNGSMDVTKNLKVTGSLDVAGDIKTNVALISDNPHGASYAAFSHKNQGTATGYALLQHSGGETYLNAPANKNINLRIHNTTKMRLIANGNVGIGTITPADQLDVSGGVRLLSGSNPVRFTSKWSGFPDRTTNQSEISNDTSNYKTLMIIGNKSAGLGRRVSVWDRLEVNGTLIVNPSGTGNFVFEQMSGVDYIGSTYVMRPHATYYGSIGHPKYLIRNMYVHDLWYNYDKKHSDVRIKKNIRSIPSSFSDLLKLKGRLYDIREGAKAPGEPKEALKNRLGFIAQEVKEVFPQLVSFNKADKSYYMEYDGIIPIIVEAIKEFKNQHDQQTDSLERMIKAQNLEIMRLKKSLN